MNILLITPYLNNYHSDMEKVLNDLGHTTKWYFDSIKLNNFEKIINKIFKNFGKKKFKKYIDSIILDNKNVRYDKVLLINGGDYFNKDIILELKKNIKAEYIYYTWDSMNNYPNVKNFIKCFEHVFSFDKDDCKEYNMSFRPLFYCDDYNDVSNTKYDVCSIMTYHKNKSESYNKIKSLIPTNLKCKEYLYISNKKKFKLSYIFNKKTYSNIDKNMIHFVTLNRNDAYKLVKNSKVVIDCPRSKQNGLTMRTFETLAFKRKLITTNKNIIDYDFYCSDNIFVVDEFTKDIPLEFFLSKFNDEYVLSSDYSVESFILSILDIKKEITK